MQANNHLALALILIPLFFNVVFAVLAKNFDYPDILRKPTSYVLEKFIQGGYRLILTWWLFMLTAVAFIPMSIALPSILEMQNQTLKLLAVSFGLVAGLVQVLGLSRWVFLVPFLARENQNADQTYKSTIDLLFQSSNRYIGVAVGEHLGYLFTGLWSAVIGYLLSASTSHNYPLGVSGIVIGFLLILCSLEFVGPNEEKGWSFAAKITPMVYIAWSVWLISIGLSLLLQ